MVSSDRERKKELLCGGMEKCMSEVIVVTSGKGGVGKTTKIGRASCRERV